MPKRTLPVSAISGKRPRRVAEELARECGLEVSDIIALQASIKKRAEHVVKMGAELGPLEMLALSVLEQVNVELVLAGRIVGLAAMVKTRVMEFVGKEVHFLRVPGDPLSIVPCTRSFALLNEFMLGLGYSCILNGCRSQFEIVWIYIRPSCSEGWASLPNSVEQVCHTFRTQSSRYRVSLRFASIETQALDGRSAGGDRQ